MVFFGLLPDPNVYTFYPVSWDTPKKLRWDTHTHPKIIRFCPPPIFKGGTQKVRRTHTHIIAF